MHPNRKTISKGLRFDILNRDGFKCRYCGIPASDTKLVVDHVIPVADMGPTTPDNLVSACEPCNQGKKAKALLLDGPGPIDIAVRESERSVIEELARKAAKTASDRTAIEDSIGEYWCDTFHQDTMDMPTLRVLMSYARQHGVENVFSWIDLCSAKGDQYWSDQKRGRYISGIRRKMVEGD